MILFHNILYFYECDKTEVINLIWIFAFCFFLHNMKVSKSSEWEDGGQSKGLFPPQVKGLA